MIQRGFRRTDEFYRYACNRPFIVVSRHLSWLTYIIYMPASVAVSDTTASGRLFLWLITYEVDFSVNINVAQQEDSFLLFL